MVFVGLFGLHNAKENLKSTKKLIASGLAVELNKLGQFMWMWDVQ